ncbi:MAG TPA: efflux RND transporter periplasmic adaptor subunit [Gemmatimonadaceae bacterium]|nr:efflux RND transporter periplasmic adaptor subunit [Gemmatimonadaceae bacterium]
MTTDIRSLTAPAAFGSTNDAGHTDPAVVPHNETDPSPFGPRMSRPRRVIWGVAGAVVLIAAVVITWAASRRQVVTAEGHNHVAPQAAAAATPVMISDNVARRIGVTYAPVIMAPLAREVRTVGQVTFDETRLTSVSPKIDGWVEQLYVNFTGQFVRRGDPLFSIYSPMLVTAQEELVLAKRLAVDVSSGTPEAARGAQDLVVAARRRLLYWNVPDADVARLEATGEVQRTVTLRAPVSGYVVDKPVLAGQQIMAGTAVYRIADLSVVWIEGDVFEQDIALVRVGGHVTVEVEAYPGERFHGRVEYVNPTLNADSRTLRVHVHMANPGLRLKPGMYATIQLTGVAGGPVMSVPRSAVLETGTRALVFVKRSDGMLEPRLVVPGAANADRMSIVSGLSPADTVVASATFLIDAESNLKAAIDAMAGMPGMDTAAPKPGTTAPAKAPVVKPPMRKPDDDPHADHRR